MKKQPEAMRLAEYLEDLFDADGEPKQAATELRRLHEVNEDLKNGLKTSVQEMKRLKNINSELLEALEIAAPFLEDAETDYTYNTEKVKEKLTKVRAAIKKAEAKQ